LVQPDGTTVLKPDALKARVAPGEDAGEVLELGVTVATGPPHPLSSSVVAKRAHPKGARDGWVQGHAVEDSRGIQTEQTSIRAQSN